MTIFWIIAAVVVLYVTPLIAIYKLTRKVMILNFEHDLEREISIPEYVLCVTPGFNFLVMFLILSEYNSLLSKYEPKRKDDWLRKIFKIDKDI